MTSSKEHLKELLTRSLAQLEQEEPQTPLSYKLLPIGKAAKALGLSRCTVWRMVREGRIRAVELRAGRRRIPESELARIVGGEA